MSSTECYKTCPNCSTAFFPDPNVCDNLECLQCHIRICWVCLATFNNSSDCYKHLDSQHGGYWSRKK